MKRKQFLSLQRDCHWDLAYRLASYTLHKCIANCLDMKRVGSLSEDVIALFEAL